MRHQDVIGIAAVRKYAEAFHGAAEILLAAPARPATAAADPRIRQHARADAHALGVRSGRHHLADILMAERDRQLHAAVGETKALAATPGSTQPSARGGSLGQPPAASTLSSTSLPVGFGVGCSLACSGSPQTQS